MRKCVYCGNEYPDEIAVCTIDQEPLKSESPPPSEEKVGGGCLRWGVLGVGRQNVSGTKATIMIAATCLMAVVVTWLYWPAGSGNGDEATNRDFMGCFRSLHLLTIAQKVLPAYAADLFHLSEREAKIAAKFQADQKALVKSGYYIEVPIIDSNRTMPQTVSNIQRVFREAHAYALIGMVTNSIIVLCRPEHTHLCAKAIGN